MTAEMKKVLATKSLVEQYEKEYNDALTATRLKFDDILVTLLQDPKKCINTLEDWKAINNAVKGTIRPETKQLWQSMKVKHYTRIYNLENYYSKKAEKDTAQ